MWGIIKKSTESKKGSKSPFFSPISQYGGTSAPEMLCGFMAVLQELENRTCPRVHTSPPDSVKSHTVFCTQQQELNISNTHHFVLVFSEYLLQTG